jgi:hypothetical protein
MFSKGVDMPTERRSVGESGGREQQFQYFSERAAGHGINGAVFGQMSHGGWLGIVAGSGTL